MAYILPNLIGCEHGMCPYCPPRGRCSPPQPERGWKCPGCGHSYAPWVPECHHCPVPAEIDGCP